jgi:hypothetical protein
MPRFSESTGEGAVLEWFERFGYGQSQTRKAETWTLLPKLLSGEIRIETAATPVDMTERVGVTS